MNDKNAEQSIASRWFWIFILVHYLVWTLAPIAVRYNLPLDATEGTIWAHQLEWSYDKNPFLNGWLTALALKLDGHNGWMIYHFCQLSVVACFISIWQIAKRMLAPYSALISVMLLEGVQYYNLHALDFNDNTLELGLWGLTIACFYWAVKIPSSSHRENEVPGFFAVVPWLLTGVFAAFALMAKYYTLALLASMGLFLLLRPAGRKQLTQLPPYLALTAFIAIIMPHIFWLFAHDFTTVRYVFMRASSEPHWTNHLYFPAQFAWQQVQAFLPAIALFLLLLIGKRPWVASTRKLLPETDKAFLLYIGLGPFLLTVILSFLTGIKLRAGWGMPLLSCWGVVLIALTYPLITTAKLYRFIGIISVLITLLAGGYANSLIDSDTPSSANFPGKEIGTAITELWHEKFHTRLAYVAGSRWAAGNVAFHSPDRPAVLIEWDQTVSPWIDLRDLRKKGAVFVWCITDNEVMADEVRKRFPALKPTLIKEFHWHRNTHHLPAIKIGVAVLPPS